MGVTFGLTMPAGPIESLGSLLGVRPGERRPTAAMFSLLGLIIATSYILKPVRSAVFLTAFGAEKLPYVYILIAGVLAAIAAGFSRIVQRYSLERLFTSVSFFFAVNLILFWWALESEWTYTPYYFYVWVSVFTIVMPSLFWLLANYVFYPNEARRLFSVVTAGGLLGSIAGGSLTSILVGLAGTSSLLLFAAGALVLISGLAKWIHQSEGGRIAERLVDLKRRETRQIAKKTGSVLRLIVRSRYLVFITVLTAVTSITSTLVDYQFNTIAERSFATVDALTGFFGTFFASINAVAFVAQLLLAGRVLSSFGVGVGLRFLPTGLFAGAMWFWGYPSLWSASFLKLSDDGFSNSVNKSSLEILYLPVSLEVKNRTKTWLDMFVDRAGRGIGGLLILLATAGLSLSVSQMSVFVLALVTPWLVLTYLVQNEYVRAFRFSLARRDIDVASLTAEVKDQQSLQVLHQVLESTDERQILYALELLRGSADERLLEPALRLLRHRSPNVRAAALRLLCSYERPPTIDHIDRLIRDPDRTVRAEALTYLYKTDEVLGRERLNKTLQSGDIDAAHAVLDSMSAAPELLEDIIDEALVSLYLESDKEEERALGARAIGFISVEDRLQATLRRLLEDPSPRVARAAAESAARMRDPRLLAPLVRQLRRRDLRAGARAALARFDDRVVEPVSALMVDAEQELELRRSLPRVLAEFESQTAVNRLFAALPQRDLSLHYQLIKALGKMRIRYPRLRLYRSEVDRILEHEATQLGELAAKLAVMTEGEPPVESDEGDESRTLLAKALRERVDYTRERIFRLLGLVYPPEDIFNAWNGMERGRPAVRAAALEFLGNLLSAAHRQRHLPLIEATLPGKPPSTGGEPLALPSPSRRRALADLVVGPDAWLATCAVTVIGHLGLTDLRETVESVVAHSDPLTREAAQYALGRLAESGPKRPDHADRPW